MDKTDWYISPSAWFTASVLHAKLTVKKVSINFIKLVLPKCPVIM